MTQLISRAASRLAASLLVQGTLGKGSDQVGYRDGWSAKDALDILYYGVFNVADKRFAGGAKLDGAADDTAAIRAAVAAAPAGALVFIPTRQDGSPGRLKLTDEVVIDKPLRIQGTGCGSFISEAGSGVFQTNAAKNAFTLKARTENYAFGQYGIVGVHFMDLAIVGPSNASRGKKGVGVDTTVNGGDFHIRECSLSRVVLRNWEQGFDFTGIAYLNNFFHVQATQCDTAWKVARGAASDSGGQTRFFGCSAVLCKTVASLNEDTSSGSFAFFGCTLSESQFGIRINEEAQLTVQGCEFEKLTNAGAGAGIYIAIKEANPSSGAARTITGNKFLSSDCDIWIDKQTTAFAGGGFFWAMLIDGNYFGSAEAIRITVPANHTGIDSPAMVLGAANTGLNNGALQDSQVSANFLGTDMRKRRFTRRYRFDATYVSGKALDSLPVGLCVTSARMFLTAQATAFTQLQLGDGANGSRYAAFNGQTQALNTWVGYSGAPPQVVIDGNSNKLAITGTAGMFSAAGWVEIDGYMT